MLSTSGSAMFHEPQAGQTPVDEFVVRENWVQILDWIKLNIYYRVHEIQWGWAMGPNAGEGFKFDEDLL